MAPPNEGFILGVDLGSNSVGWALVARTNGEPTGLIRAGARVFDAGMEGDMESGHEESRNVKRREARLHRRQLWRRARRLKKIFRLLQEFDLLPKDRIENPEQRQNLLNNLDRNILASDWFKAKEKGGTIPEPRQVLPYLLRAAALDENLELHFLGRALYHLAQRRGFLSNRKQSSVKKKDDDEGKVKSAIKSLRNEMGEATLGQYFSRTRTFPIVRRIRGHKTHRDMYKEEFNRIWEAQTQHYSDLLKAERKATLFDAIFHQRPLKDQSHLIGPCELEPDQRRAPTYLLPSQRFRLLQKVNDLRIVLPEGGERELSSDERAKLIEKLEETDEQKFDQIAKLLKLKDCEFNLQRGNEKKIPGNRTAAKFRKVFGKGWQSLPPEEQEKRVAVVYDCEDDQTLKETGQKEWGLDADAAAKLCEIKFESSYLNLSRVAIEKLLPLLKEGFSYGTLAPFYRHITPETTLSLLNEVREGIPPKLAAQVVFAGRANPAGEPKDLLPPVAMEIPWLRNPAVMRSLTELRKVVNAIVRQYGRPQEIRVELARELKKPKWRRKEISKRNSENRTTRDQAKKKIEKETGDPYPSPYDIRKVILCKECKGLCVYCGKQMGRSNFFGENSDAEVDHIIPFSRLQDDSFTNVVLCHTRCNREKGNRTPSEAFTGEEYERILEHVRLFHSDDATRRAKLWRFSLAGEELAKFLQDFSNRQLNDTAYGSTLARRYLGTLYGGIVDSTGKTRVKASSGGVTAYLRNGWDLNRILNDGPTTHGGFVPKRRNDHRHHAVDAVVIALTDESTIQQLSRAAERGFYRGKPFAPLEGRWLNFVPSIKAEIDRVVVSHRVSKKVSGPLHGDTFFSPEKKVRRNANNGTKSTELEHHLRRALSPNQPSRKQISETELKDIVPTNVHKIVMAKLEELGGDLKKFADPENLPFFTVKKTGKRIPIKSVRIRVSDPIFKVGSDWRARHVTSIAGSNHHVEILEVLDKHDRVVAWDADVVEMRRAYERKNLRQPIVSTTHEPGIRFLFSLSPGEVVECDDSKGQKEFLVYKSGSQYTAGQKVISFVRINDAKNKLIRRVPNWLRERNARKVAINPLGDKSEVSEAHD